MSASVWEKLRETECLPDLSVLPNSLMSIVKVGPYFCCVNFIRNSFGTEIVVLRALSHNNT